MKTLLIPALLAMSITGLQAPAQNLKYGPASAPKGASQPIDEIGLVVNDEAITRRQLTQEMEAARRNLPKELKLPAGELEHQLLEHVIMNHLLAQIEKKVGLEISEDELNTAIAQIAGRNKVSEQKLYAQAQRDTGLSRDAFREQVRKSLAQEHMKEGMVGADINITERQVDEYIAKLAREQGSTIHVQDLLIPLPEGDAQSRAGEVDAKIREVSQALRDSGGNLQQASARVAGARYNDLGDVNLGRIPPRFARALAKLGAGEIVESPVVDDDGMHFLKVASKHSAEGNYTLAEAAATPKTRRARPKAATSAGSAPTNSAANWHKPSRPRRWAASANPSKPPTATTSSSCANAAKATKAKPSCANKSNATSTPKRWTKPGNNACNPCAARLTLTSANAYNSLSHLYMGGVFVTKIRKYICLTNTPLNSEPN